MNIYELYYIPDTREHLKTTKISVRECLNKFLKVIEKNIFFEILYIPYTYPIPTQYDIKFYIKFLKIIFCIFNHICLKMHYIIVFLSD